MLQIMSMKPFFWLSDEFRVWLRIIKEDLSDIRQQILHWVFQPGREGIVANDSALVRSYIDAAYIRITEILSLVDNNFSLNTGCLVEFYLTLKGNFFDQRDVFLETFDLYILLKHFYESLNYESLQQISVNPVVPQFFSQSILDLLLDPLNELISELHLDHSGFVDLPALHDFDLCLQCLLLLVKVAFVLLSGLIQDFIPLELLLILGLLLNQANLMVLIPLDSKFEFVKSYHEFLFVVDVLHLQLKYLSVYFIKVNIKKITNNKSNPNKHQISYLVSVEKLSPDCWQYLLVG